MATPTSSHSTSTSYESAFIASLPLIRDVARAVCRRCHLPADDESEFTSSLVMKLIEDDYKVFRRFRGQCELRTFIFTVAYRHLIDLRNKAWGRWRPSALALRLGPAAVYLEQLLVRDHTAPVEAINLLAHDPRWQVTSAEAQQLQAQLPVRPPRGRVEQPIGRLAEQFGDDRRSGLEQGERRRDAGHIRRALQAVFVTLSARDRHLLRLRFRDGRSIVDIAAMTQTDARGLYRHFEHLLLHLREQLLAQQCTSMEVRRLLSCIGDGDSLLGAGSGQ